MSKSKILVIQYYTDNLEYAEYSEALNKEYCNRHGYDYFVESNSEKLRVYSRDNEIALQWYKVPFLLETLKTKPEYDWVMFLDMDAIFANKDRKIEEFLDDKYNLILGNDVAAHSAANTGVIFVKNNDWSINFLEQWWSARNDTSGQDAIDLIDHNGGGHAPDDKGIFRSSLWHEQTVLTVAMAKDTNLKNHIKIIDDIEINCPYYDSNGFIFHAFAYGCDKYRNLNLIHEARTSTLDPTKKITVVYFVYCYQDYIDLVNADFKRIKDVGLYDDCDNISVVYSVPDPEKEEVETNKLNDLFGSYDKVKLHKHLGNNFEHYGVVRTWIESHQSEGYVLYFHTKGITAIYTESNDHCEWKKRADESFIENLKYYMIDNYRDCLDKLENENYDLCTVSDSYSMGWPSGNFWWANKKYVRNTRYPYETTWSRWASECWVNQHKTEFKIFQFYERFGFRDKFTYIPEASYKDPASLSDKKIILQSAKLMTLMEPENENDLNRPSETHEVDFTEFVSENLKNNNYKGFTDIYVSFTSMGREIEDPCYGVLKSLVIEFKIEDDDTLYRLVGDEGQLLNYIIDKPTSIGYHLVDNQKTVL